MFSTTCAYAGGCENPARLAVVDDPEVVPEWCRVQMFCGPSHAALYLIALAERRGGIDDDLALWASVRHRNDESMRRPAVRVGARA